MFDQLQFEQLELLGWGRLLGLLATFQLLPYSTVGTGGGWVRS